MNLNVKQESFRIETVMCNLRNECFDFCVKDLSTNELNSTELDCVDKCSWRYLTTHKIISTAIERNEKSKGKR
ncbi:hypothetical protein AGDE_00117 [Angomonas deanei]|uniref:Mitochondrial import inner membrane translocase subunit n=1 Tax=Angomonas deanei TaxID=59799 RepID=A0A7G2CEP0_9TRYP|nr:hypothetical protein AGDE_00117 [Angomonas deanei]CAD2218340.1 Tim10/DDP family zinc finger containing protein, putative [Angomonas deanei]|eukprot:EPY43804.1 hypothetical protein AGDE_00117 [Angomonas deanei]